ncbi:MAG: hypothetical protein WCP79_07075 [Bacillota bacterium]
MELSNIFSGGVALAALIIIWRSRKVKLEVGDWQAMISDNRDAVNKQIETVDKQIATLQQILDKLIAHDMVLENHGNRISMLERYSNTKQQVQQENQ